MEVVVVVWFDKYWGELLCVFVMLWEGVMGVNVDIIVVYCREYFFKFYVLKMIVFCELLKMMMGKV